MASMKIIQFSRAPTPFSSYVQISSTPLASMSNFKRNLPPPSPLQMITNQLKENNPRMTIICYQVFPSGWFLFLVSTH